MSEKKRLQRSQTNRMISGVCGGLGEYFDVDPTIMRLIFGAATIFGVGSPIIIYIILIVVMPEGPANPVPPAE